MKQIKCENCGAPFKNYKCPYCGTEYVAEKLGFSDQLDKRMPLKCKHFEIDYPV